MPANPTPSLAGTAETMTAVPLDKVRTIARVYNTASVDEQMQLAKDVLALHEFAALTEHAYATALETAKAEIRRLTAALAERTAECERLIAEKISLAEQVEGMIPPGGNGEDAYALCDLLRELDALSAEGT